MPGNLKGVLFAVTLAVAAAAAHYGANAERRRAAIGYYLVGLAVAALAGFLFFDAGIAGFTVVLYLVVASAWQVFVLAREPAEIGFWGVAAAAGLVGVMLTADVKTAAFVAAGVVSVYGALKVIQSQVLVHATVWLAATLFGVAGIYLSLGAEFLALIQILIYVGAVVTLFLFTVMLTIPAEEAHGLDALELPPGVVIESVQDLEEATPRMGVGPYKSLKDTNPRKPVRSPPTLYGVSMADGVYGDETIEKRTSKKKEA